MSSGWFPGAEGPDPSGGEAAESEAACSILAVKVVDGFGGCVGAAGVKPAPAILVRRLTRDNLSEYHIQRPAKSFGTTL